MTNFKSFDNSKEKLRLSWENNNKNTNEIKDLKELNPKSFSSNFYKNITNIPVINKNYIEPTENIVAINLNNYPEWIINHIIVFPLIEFVGDINTDTIYTNISSIDDKFFNSSNNQINLKIGDLLYKTEFKYWITKLSNNNYILKIFFDINTRIITTVGIPTPGSFNTEFIPFNLNLSLKIINPRIYELKNQFKK